MVKISVIAIKENDPMRMQTRARSHTCWSLIETYLPAASTPLINNDIEHHRRQRCD
jgi:hypothetical protein